MKGHLVSTMLILGTSMSPAQAKNVMYEVEPDHSFVIFEVVHSGTSTTRGRFDTVEGTVALDRKAKTGRADIHIDPASINSGSPGFDQHLRGPDFFNVEVFPKASFQSADFVFDGEKVARLSGTLSLLGIDNAVELKATNFNCYDNKRIKREVCGGDFETTIQRSQWGMRFGIPGIPDAVRVVVQIEAIRQ